MILVDVNLLVYASVAAFAEHARARAWLDDKLNGLDRVGLPWASLNDELPSEAHRRPGDESS